jgi:hypothetical protein
MRELMPLLWVMSDWVRRRSTSRLALGCLALFLGFAAFVLPAQSSRAEMTSQGDRPEVGEVIA